MTSCGVGRLHLWLGCVVATTLTVVGSAAQTALPLDRLTVPPGALPTGCRVHPYSPARNATGTSDALRVTASAGPSRTFPGNPWVGSDRQFLNSLLDTNAAPLPDGPPPTLQALRRMQSQALQHVREGYRAVYDSPGGAMVEVRALRFDDEQHLPDPSILMPDRRQGPLPVDHFAIGTVSVQITATAGTGCSGAIDAYLRALK